MRLVSLSDTHNQHSDLPEIPDGDLLIHAGDALGRGSLQDLQAFLAWMETQPHQYKILIAGNHDWVFQREPEQARCCMEESSVIYLQDQSIEIEGIRFYGSPWQPAFKDWAFNLERGEPLAERWALIPEDTQVLITHGPPMGILDEIFDRRLGKAQPSGCQQLSERITQLPALKAHIFGHIHEGYGLIKNGGVTYINASTCNTSYNPINPPIVLDI